MNLTCACGNDFFKAQKVTLILRGLPCEITEDGPKYDDAEAEQSEGWDYNQESRVICAACGKEYDIAQDSQANICLQPVSGHASQPNRNGFGNRVAEPGQPYLAMIPAHYSAPPDHPERQASERASPRASFVTP